MTRSATTSKVLLSIGVSLVVLFTLPYVLTFFFPWTKINCIIQSIDVNGARCRSERYFWFIKLSDTVQDTNLARLYRDLGGQPAPPQWRIVNTFSPPGKTSPHYRFHGALAAAHLLSRFVGQENLNHRERKEIIEKFLQHLQQQSNDEAADEYVQTLFEDGQFLSRPSTTPYDSKSPTTSPSHALD